VLGFLGLLASCAAPVKPAAEVKPAPPAPAPTRVKESAPPKTTRPGDTGPVVAALAHFHSLPDLFLSGTKDDGAVLVEGYYGGKSGYLSPGQIAGELSDEGWTIPEEARADLERRALNEGRVSLSKLPPTLRLFEFAEEDAYFDFGKHHPEARAWVSLWRPGYTRDGKQAVVRFMFGPTPHGAAATYLLEFRGNEWHVLHHALSYFA
jgi:hypothetical protein